MLSREPVPADQPVRVRAHFPTTDGLEDGGESDDAGDPATSPHEAAVPVDPAEAADGRFAAEPAGDAEPILPESVRARVVAVAAAAMSGLPVDDVPQSLRRVAQFAPNRRARLGAAAIAYQLATDVPFRLAIASRVRAAAGELGSAVLAGTPPAAADPVEVAALAYLIRPARWLELLDAARTAMREDAVSGALANRLVDAEHRADRAEHERAVARVEAEKLRDELIRLRAETDNLRDEIRALTRSAREAGHRERKAADLLATERGRATRAAAEADAEQRRLRARLADAEIAASGARALARDARQVDDARTWLLLETISQASASLRRELALQVPPRMPADYIADELAERPDAVGRTGARALSEDDPARLDQLMGLPRAHLIVDGYNVTKRGFGEISLEHQRSRLVAGLGALAAQSGSEVTVVFDGAEKMPAALGTPRGVRVLFSRKGQTADEVIRQLVRAEPAGRPVVVISSDREVADGVRRHGAYPLSSDTLLRRLARS
jgi:predicted RNA-binding protein with PIN domain